MRRGAECGKGDWGKAYRTICQPKASLEPKTRVARNIAKNKKLKEVDAKPMVPKATTEKLTSNVVTLSPEQRIRKHMEDYAKATTEKLTSNVVTLSPEQRIRKHMEDYAKVYAETAVEALPNEAK